MTTKKFCVVPWREIYSTTLGSYRMCCIEDETGPYRHNQTSIADGLDVHWNSDYMKKNRLDFLSGKGSDCCKQCWKEDANGKISLRQRRNQQYLGATDSQLDPWIDFFKSKTQSDGSAEMDIHGVYISVGNTCQLRCTHCSPSYSSGVAKEYQKLGWESDFKTRRIILDDRFLGASRQKAFDAEAWPQLKSIAHKLKYIRCTGGEPSVSKGLLEFMHWLDKEGLAKNIVFMSNTNAVSVKDEWIEAASKFKHTELKIGLDGTSQIDHYTRYPTIWEKKLPIVMKLLDKFPTSYVLTTLHCMNIADFPNLLQETQNWPGRHEVATLTYPTELDISHMPDQFKQTMIEKLSEWVSGEEEVELPYPYPKQEYRENGIRAAIRRLKRPGDPAQWEKAKSIIQQYDTVRPYTLSSVSPLLAPYL